MDRSRLRGPVAVARRIGRRAGWLPPTADDFRPCIEVPRDDPGRLIPTPDEPAFGNALASAVVYRGYGDSWEGRSWSIESLAEHLGDPIVTVAQMAGNRPVEQPGVGLALLRTRLSAVLEAQRLGPDAGYVHAGFEELPPQFRFEAPTPTALVGRSRLRGKLWISAAGSVTPMHRDAPHNLLVQVLGQKTVRLVAATFDGEVYPHPPWSHLPNFARVDPLAPDSRRFPRFAEASVEVVKLAPGDALYLPSGTWHHVVSDTDSISVNFWWTTGLTTMLAAVVDAYKRVRGLHR